MAYEEDLAHRVRELIGDERGLSEMRMFGGLAFLLDGNMAVAVSSKGGLMLRLDPERLDELRAMWERKLDVVEEFLDEGRR